MRAGISGAAITAAIVGFAWPAWPQPIMRQHSTDPLDWIIQHVCADAQDKPVSADPYDGCPAGTHERRLKLGDPLPYLRHGPPGKNGGHPLGFVRRDAYPLVDLHDGGIISANDRDFAYLSPYGRLEPADGGGYDVFRLWNGYVTSSVTRDGAGYSQTMFGADCRPYGGQLFFPASFLKDLKPGAEGSAAVHVHGDYWEQRGEPWPGRCDATSRFSQHASAEWFFEPAHKFGGINGSKIKILDAIVVTHGPAGQPSPAQQHYHLERFYFTDMYGLTRFEAWWPKGAKELSPKCSDNPEMTYHGVVFVATACGDASATEILDVPRPRFPWPYPEINLLANWHFDKGALAPWRLGESVDAGGGGLDWKLGVSATERDTQYAVRRDPSLIEHGGGVKFLRIGCRGECGADAAIYQDIPAPRRGEFNQFDYGFTAVADSSGPVAMKATLSLRNREGRTVWSDSFDATVPNEYRGHTVTESVYRASSVFLHTSEKAPSADGAESLRLTLSPKTPGPIDILDTWVMPR